jgi:hypothetical protein
MWGNPDRPRSLLRTGVTFARQDESELRTVNQRRYKELIYELLANDRYRYGARKFSSLYAGFSRERQISDIVQRINELTSAV